MILAEEERSWRKQRRCFERAVAAAEQAAVEEGWLQEACLEGDVSLYRQVPGRTYLRAKLALARCLAEGGYVPEAQTLYQKLLELDREDHMGIRYETLQVCHLQDDYEGLRTVLDRYPDDEMATFSYERLWLALITGADPEAIEHLAGKAGEANAHVPSFLLGEAKMPDTRSEYIQLGAEDEAASYAEMAARWWQSESRAMAWLRGRHGSGSKG